MQQTPAFKPQVTASVSQPSYGQQTSSQQSNSQPQNSFWQQKYDKINQVADKFANNTEGAAIAFTQGLSGNNFDELAGIAGTAITTGYDIRAKHTDFKEKHPQLDEALEIGGTLYGGIKKPFISAVLYGIGSAETAEQIPEEITYNALGNKYVQKIPTHILPQKVAPIAKEYLSRIIPEWLKKYINE